MAKLQTSKALQLALGLTAAALLAAGCAAPSEAEKKYTTPADLVGLDIEDAREHVKTAEGGQIVVQDYSNLVHKEPSYSDDSSGWTVIAACSDNNKLVDAQKVDFIVVPHEDYQENKKLQEDVQKGAFEKDLVNCS